MAGSGFAGPDGHPIELGQLALYGAGDTVVLEAGPSGPLDVILLGGEPIGEPVAHYGPFVMNTVEELHQAVEDYQAGRLGQIPANGLRPFRG
jgi:hypothetical protein